MTTETHSCRGWNGKEGDESGFCNRTDTFHVADTYDADHNHLGPVFLCGDCLFAVNRGRAEHGFKPWTPKL